MPKPRPPTHDNAVASADASAEISEKDLKEGERRRAGELSENPEKT